MRAFRELPSGARKRQFSREYLPELKAESIALRRLSRYAGYSVWEIGK
jgi:hypothetical protein